MFINKYYVTVQYMKYQSKLNAGIDSDLELKVKLEIVETQEIFCKLHWEPSGQQCKKSLQQTALFKGQHPYSGNGWLSIAVVLNLLLNITLFKDFWSQITQKSKFSQKKINKNTLKGQFLMQFLQENSVNLISWK